MEEYRGHRSKILPIDDDCMISPDELIKIILETLKDSNTEISVPEYIFKEKTND